MLHNLDTTPHIAFGILKGLAGFTGENLGNFIVMFFQQRLVTHHYPGAFGNRGFSPGLEYFAGIVDGTTHFRICRAGRTCDDFVGGRIGDVNPLVGLAFYKLTSDIKGYVFHSGVPCHCCRYWGVALRF